MALFRHPKSPLYSAKGVSPNEQPLFGPAVQRAFQEAGYCSIQQRAQSNIPYRQVALRLLNSCLRVYNAVDWLWVQCGLGRWFGTFLITCGRKPSGAWRLAA
jgi:hypothetical protein